eukprot:Gb_40741 [translate_table: standard]
MMTCSLIFYCKESRQLMLVYEYMPGGSLKDHLYGPTAELSKLDWKTRLKIALDAAQGMEYLHVGFTPKIIHSDVKSANILLDKNMTGPTAELSKLDWKTRLKIALDAAQGMEYLHVGFTPKIIHSDVKSANILLDKNMTGKLDDFGLS